MTGGQQRDQHPVENEECGKYPEPAIVLAHRRLVPVHGFQVRHITGGPFLVGFLQRV